MCTPVADSCWYMAKPIQYCKVKIIIIIIKLKNKIKFKKRNQKKKDQKKSKITDFFKFNFQRLDRDGNYRK